MHWNPSPLSLLVQQKYCNQWRRKGVFFFKPRLDFFYRTRREDLGSQIRGQSFTFKLPILVGIKLDAIVMVGGNSIT